MAMRHGARPARRVFALAVIAALVRVVVQDARPANARGLEDPGSFQLIADSLMTAEMARNHIPGGVLVAVRGGEIFFARGYGYADLEHQTPVDPERTIFRAASVSKVLTATAAMQQVEQGRLALDVDVNRYLKRFQIERRDHEPVTLFHLLTHTAGFDDRNIDRKAWAGTEAESLGAYLALRMPPRIVPPGRTISYSNHGMALTGYLVEAVSGQPFDRYMHDHVFAPLGMTRSSFGPEAMVPADLATGHDDSNPPRRVPADYVKTAPASMLTTTGADMARFAIAHLRNGRAGSGRILEERTAEEMHRRQFTQDALLPGIAFGFWERFQNGERALWHDGDGAGFASLLYLLPEHDTGFFIVFNGQAGGTARRLVLTALLDRYFPEQRAMVPPQPYAGAAREARRCAGVYVSNRYGHQGLEKLSSLASQVDAQVDSGNTLSVLGNQYVAIAPLRFQRVDGRSHLVFEADARGRVVRMFTGETIARVYERVPGYAAARFQLIVVVGCVGAFLWALVVWPLAMVLRRLRRRPPRTGHARPFEVVAIVLSGLNLVFLFGLGAYLLESPSPLEYGVPPLFVALLTIPLLSSGLGAALVLLCLRSWRSPAPSLGSRFQYAVVTAAAVGFVAWLAQWNLLGYRF